MTHAVSLPRLERLMVSRPAAEAGRWVQDLIAAGWPAEPLPLIAIVSPTSPDELFALAQARAHWAQWDALMFVSGAAVTHFFDGACASAPAGCRTRFWAPGPGTGRSLTVALRALGVSGASIDMPPADAAQFDSEALWPVVRGQMGPGKRVLVVRGASEAAETAAASTPMLAGHGREWLIQQCRAMGAEVNTCVAYERAAPRWSDALRAQALAATVPGSVWLFSSSEAVLNLCQGLSQTRWTNVAALVTHPRIAQTAQEAGFGEVQIARPAIADVLRALESHWSPP